VFVHLCSTKIPYKTVGKEYIAERLEIEKEILNGLHVVARELRLFLSKRIKREHAEQRREVYSKYLAKINEFTASVINQELVDLAPVLERVIKYKEVDGNAQTSS
jgi:DNA topoisomerase-6 subunit B